MPCTTATECPDPGNECLARTCDLGQCGTQAKAAGTATAAQTPGDCHQKQCDGAGAIVDAVADTDLPVDANECTHDLCTAGAPSHPLKPVNTACGAGGALKCDILGQCVGCIVVADCAGQDTDCQTRTCTLGACSMLNAPQGKLTTAQTAGDCQSSQCDGNGAVEKVADNADVPADAKACTKDLCLSGTPSNPPQPAGTVCAEGTGTQCDGAGKCVACIAATDCPGMNTECQQRSCTAGVCGTAFAVLGTPLATQTPSDCKKLVCNGSGGTTSQNDDADLPGDNNACTTDVCTGGVPSHGNAANGTSCGAGVVCLNGSCSGCSMPSDCPGVDDECKTRTCGGGTCGFTFTAGGTAVAAQTAGDCAKKQCDGTGNTVSVADNADVPADDGNQCTSEVCTAGVPSHPANPINTACTQNGGAFCSATGACVACNAATQCAGTDTECHARTCTGNTCGTNNTAAGTPTTAQTIGDCQKSQCDGAGSTVSATDNSDLPADDGSQCTSEVCTAGVPSHPASPIDTACIQNGGSVCSAVGTCVECNAAAQCPGMDTECQVRACTGNTCGTNFAAAGTPTTTQTAGDCQRNQCDGAGSTASAADNTDLPNDGNQCTSDLCVAGVPSLPSSPQGTACNQAGGTVCNATGACIAVPQVASTTPSEATLPIAAPAVAVTFTIAMNPATLTGQTTAGACSGSIQVSLDNFASCVAFSTAAATMSGGNTTATFTAAPGLLVNRIYKIRVTTAATSALGAALASQFTLATGFTTTSPNLCQGSLVISQVYGAGGNTGATYKNDFIELHNRGTTTVSLTGMSLQYAAATNSNWSSVVPLSGSVAPGGYFLVQLAGGTVGASLPTPDLSSTTINMAAGAGKIALINSVTQVPTGACPPAATTIDFVGFGSTATCSEGSTTGTTYAPAPSATTADIRIQNGCADINVNGPGAGTTSQDFIAGTPVPRNTASAVVACACFVENESGAALEADYVTVQFPPSLSTQTGTATALVYGRIYDMGTTEAAGANGNVRAQLGYGPATANPEYEAGWTWTNATYNASFVDPSNDEYQASFTAPAVGAYRYVYRFSLDQGVSWTYADQNAGDGGAGSNTGLLFEFASEPVLTVTP